MKILKFTDNHAFKMITGRVFHRAIQPDESDAPYLKCNGVTINDLMSTQLIETCTRKCKKCFSV